MKISWTHFEESFIYNPENEAKLENWEEEILTPTNHKQKIEGLVYWTAQLRLTAVLIYLVYGISHFRLRIQDISQDKDGSLLEVILLGWGNDTNKTIAFRSYNYEFIPSPPEYWRDRVLLDLLREEDIKPDDDDDFWSTIVKEAKENIIE